MVCYNNFCNIIFYYSNYCMNSEQDIGGLKEKAIALENQMNDFRIGLRRIEDKLTKQLADGITEIKRLIEQKVDKSEIIQIRQELHEERKKIENMQTQLETVKTGWNAWGVKEKIYTGIVLMFVSMFMTLFSIVMTQIVTQVFKNFI